jgi:ppGpp synthetase/RelA/SpoT-type nucleotidyltranferase
MPIRERHDKPSGYRATHMLVELGADEDHPSLRGFVCELQIASLGAHLFNEIEHDTTYKIHDVPPSAAETDALAELRAQCRRTDALADRVLEEHEKGRDAASEEG